MRDKCGYFLPRKSTCIVSFHLLVLYCIVLYCIVLYCIVLCCIVVLSLYITHNPKQCIHFHTYIHTYIPPKSSLVSLQERYSILELYVCVCVRVCACAHV